MAVNNSEIREQLEREKLQADIANAEASTRDLDRSDMSRPTFWIGVATALIAVFGVFLQAYLSKNEYVLASIQKERAEIDRRLAESERDNLQKQQVVLKDELARLDVVIKNLNTRKENIQTEVTQLQQVRAALSTVVPNASQSDRFVPVPADAKPNDFLRDMLDGWWQGASIRAIHWVDQADRRGWELTEAK